MLGIIAPKGYGLSQLTLRIVPLGGGGRTAGRYLGFYARVITFVLAYGLTVGRLLLSAFMLTAIRDSEAFLAVVLLAIFVVVDIYDGVVARQFNLETGLRRGLDGFIDKVSIHVIAGFVCMGTRGGLVIWLIIIGRDICQAAVGAWVLYRKRVIAAGAKWHRAFTLSIAVWGGLLIVTRDLWLPIAALVVLLGFATIVDYVRQCVAYLRGTWHNNGAAALEIGS
ncbi:hypothetical protein GCM10012320_08060 [Sinomonas cellulolyticus]|uniref:CDP-alcohol phosphatidyltransferase family protein n=1 Tax=Sinomonas cellulolyticus TaxID=2801916 RepID=A0ABS1K479_9MICC|nr:MULTISPECIES: CDP-alcohol phosphatidyltransferase family protein [Sinomonas]MBL0706273.1 CDP-alcohol phosphatidyltransferase family protein [Sinomonas cellulolyticus]GHG43785.1 hypothetical protein GCM10012320_08060 [Sinomonas sp. KCTC 49339]